MENIDKNLIERYGVDIAKTYMKASNEVDAKIKAAKKEKSDREYAEKLMGEFNIIVSKQLNEFISTFSKQLNNVKFQIAYSQDKKMDEVNYEAEQIEACKMVVSMLNNKIDGNNSW